MIKKSDLFVSNSWPDNKKKSLNLQILTKRCNKKMKNNNNNNNKGRGRKMPSGFSRGGGALNFSLGRYVRRRNGGLKNFFFTRVMSKKLKIFNILRAYHLNLGKI